MDVHDGLVNKKRVSTSSNNQEGSGSEMYCAVVGVEMWNAYQIRHSITLASFIVDRTPSINRCTDIASVNILN